MKTLKLILPATILSLALCLSAYAGDMSTPGFTSPLPPPPTQTALGLETDLESTGSGNIATSDFALDIWLAVLSFF